MIQNILLAEDDLGASLLVKKQLESFGYKVTTATNGRQALEIMGDEKIDLVITDVVMPEMDGVDLYLALKNNPQTAFIPVIIITDKEMFKESFTALGVDHFIPKNSNISLLVEKIKNVESLSPTTTQYRKILIGGAHSETVHHMKAILQGNGCLVTTANNSMDLASKAFLMTPHVLFLDLLMNDSTSAPELTQALRCLKVFKNTAIVTYIHLSANEIATNSQALEFLKDEADLCKKNGSTNHLGRFNKATFLETIEDMNLLYPTKNPA